MANCIDYTVHVDADGRRWKFMQQVFLGQPFVVLVYHQSIIGFLLLSRGLRQMRTKHVIKREKDQISLSTMFLPMTFEDPR